MKTMVPQSGPSPATIQFWKDQGIMVVETRIHRTPVGTLSRTKQSDKDNCDINLIVKRHASTGHVSHLNPAAPQFGDFTGAGDLKTAMDQVAAAEDRFMELPPEVRRAADNDPFQLLAMLESEQGQTELEEAGLVLTDRPEAPRETEKQPEPPPTTTPSVIEEANRETAT